LKSELLTSAHGIDTTLHLDQENNRLIVQNQFDAAPIIEANKIASNDGTGGWTPSRNMRKVASVPLALLQLWDSMGISPKKDRKEFLRRLNDSELSGFRTDGGSRL
tara:strand:+ start:3509 stop:3826 length:318 start_codon:yes stop_codon:yes gene_type:complete